MTKYAHRFYEENGKILYDVSPIPKNKEISDLMLKMFNVTDSKKLSEEKYDILRTEHIREQICYHENIIDYRKKRIESDKGLIKHSYEALRKLRKELKK